MALPWIKLYVSLSDNEVFGRCSSAARQTFLESLMIAGKLDSDGALRLRVGPMTVSEIAHITKLKPSIQKSALQELVNLGFMRIEPDGAYAVQRFAERQRNASTERSRRFRNKQKQREGNADATQMQRVDIDRDRDGDTPTVANATVPPSPQRVRPVVQPGPTFGDLEPVVIDFLAVLAAANKSGLISESRIANERRDIEKQIERFGPDAMEYGLREAIRRNKPAVEYAVACAKGHAPERRGDVEPERELPRFEELPLEVGS